VFGNGKLHQKFGVLIYNRIDGWNF
jgi:hypothetical protein